MRDYGMNRRTITYDNDDIAILRSSLADIGIGFVTDTAESGASYLLLLFGHNEDAFELGMPKGLHRTLYNGALRKISEAWPFDSLHRASFSNVELTCGLIDQLCDEVLSLHESFDEKSNGLAEISSARDANAKNTVDAEQLKALRELYELEEKDVRRMMADASASDQILYLYRAFSEKSQNALGKFASGADGFRRLMLETNFPFDLAVGDGVSKREGPQRSLFFGDKLVRKK